MNSTDYIARQISDVAQVTPQQVADSAQRGLGQVTPTTIQDEGVAFNPYESAINQGRQAIVVNVQAKEAAAKEKEQMTRMAQAVAEALRPNVEVGRINPEGRVEGVRLDPETIPEPKETIQAGVSAVGIGGRKGVFSELPFDAEDIPDGWDVVQTEDGGWLANPKENTDEVLSNEKTGERFKTLGYTEDKQDNADRVVQVRTPDDIVLQDVAVGAQGEGAAVEQALEVADKVGGTIDIVSPQEAIQERVQEVKREEMSAGLRSLIVLEGNDPSVYPDSQGLPTIGIGFNMKRPGAKGVFDKLGIEKFDEVIKGNVSLTDDEVNRLATFTHNEAAQDAARITKAKGYDWDSLSEVKKSILTDIQFNTGALTTWNQIFKMNEVINFLRHARRKERDDNNNLINTKGMDNRVVKQGIMLGVLTSIKKAKALFPLMTITQSTFDKLKPTKKAQPTIVTGK